MTKRAHGRSNKKDEGGLGLRGQRQRHGPGLAATAPQWSDLRRFIKRLGAICGLGLALISPVSQGASPVDVYAFPDAVTEARYRALVAEFRCPKCLNTNLAGSDAPIAQDLRAAVHRLVVVEGRTDEEVRDYLHARYGDFVLYDPPLKGATLLLWGGPALFAALGLALIVVRLRRQPDQRLSDADRARLKRILEKT